MSVHYHTTGGVRPKLVAIFLLSSLLPLALTGWMATHWISELVHDASRARLTATLDIKKSRLQHYLTQRQEEMDMLTHSTGLFYNQRLQELEALRDFYGEIVQYRFQEWLRATELFAASKTLPKTLVSIDWVFRQAGGTSKVINGARGERWRALAKEKRPALKFFRDKYGFDNVYLISIKKNVVLTAVPEPVLGGNLGEAPFTKSGLGKLFARALEKSAFQTFEPLVFLDNMPAAFMGAPILSEKTGKVVGVLAVRFSSSIFNKIKSKIRNVEPSINLYLVGPDRLKYGEIHKHSGNRKVFSEKKAKPDTKPETEPEEITSLLGLMASEARELATHRNAVAPVTISEMTGETAGKTGRVATPAVLATLEGVEDKGLVKGTDGRFMLSAWAPLPIHPISTGSADSTSGVSDHLWGVVVEQSVAQAFSPDAKGGVPFYKKQMDLSGYYDFFLIQPDGEVFYSATRQADFATNMMDGKYSDTNLGRLVQQVLEKRAFGMSDFSPYPPSHNEPAAFMAQPLVQKGTLKMVVALQLPLEAITSTMQHEHELGSHDDAYLVGPDKRMRSDSILDPKNHSVMASFAGNIAENGVDSEAVRSALAGNTGVLVGKNMTGLPILSAFTPLTLNNSITWALLVETRFMGAVMPFSAIPWTLLLTVFGTLLLCVVIVWMTASAIRRAIFQCMDQLQPLHSGKFLISTENLLKASKKGDEFGLLSREIDGVVERWQQVGEKLRDSGKHTAIIGMELTRLGKAISDNIHEGYPDGLAAGEAAIEKISVHIQEQIKHAQALEKLLGAIEYGALQGNSAMVSAIASVKEIADRTSNFVEIARQTNLLSMKAAIDVASDGKHGKKFGTVITEIIKLAEKGRIAADEVGELSFGAVRTVETANTILATFMPNMQKSTELAQSMMTTDTDQHGEVVRIHTMTQQLKERIRSNAVALKQIIPVVQNLSKKVALLQEDLAFLNPGEKVLDKVMALEGEIVPAVVKLEEK